MKQAIPPDPGTVELSPAEMIRYNRHVRLSQIGREGQRKLKAASALIVGLGGLGSPISMYLAAAGVGRIGLVDGDVVDASNLQRQIVHGESVIGMPKVKSAAARLRELNPYIVVEPYYVPLTCDNAPDLLASYDVVMDGLDNFGARCILNEAAVSLGKPYVYGSVAYFEGQVSVFGVRDGPCYRCLLPAPPPDLAPGEAAPGIFSVLPGTIGTLQANEALKLLLGIGELLVGQLLVYDALDMTFDLITLPRRPDCPVCGDRSTTAGPDENTQP
ncbi:MAG: molybdopterin-synthase adenylyltransferase MoeB [Anaerolineae bacterium]|nr:molybdopterin-synthase adenylyltransferase MoeB [Anaerolineae bacterium]